MSARDNTGAAAVGGAAACALALVITVGAVAPARADEPDDHWQKGAPRLFLSAAVDAGLVQHAALAAGYGKPHFMWGGLVAQGFLTWDFAAARVGARIDLQALAIEAGLRAGRSFVHLPLPRADRHTGQRDGGGFASRALDLSAAGGLPLGPGFAIYELLAVRHLSPAADDGDIYDELLRIVFRPPWLATASAGWVAALRGGALLVGGRAQWAFVSGRDGTPFVRLGPVVYWRLFPHVALAGELLYPVANPDRLGFTDPIQAFAEISFTAATGDAPPRWP